MTKKVVFLPPALKYVQRPGLSSTVTSWEPTKAAVVIDCSRPLRICSPKPAFFDSSSTEKVQRPLFSEVTGLPFRVRESFPAAETIASREPRNGFASEPTSDCCVEPFAPPELLEPELDVAAPAVPVACVVNVVLVTEAWLSSWAV